MKNLPPKIKRKKNLKSEKHAGKSRGQADRKREDKRNESYRNAESCLKQLGDPVDSMNINEKKIHTLSTYYQKVKVCMVVMKTGQLGKFGGKIK